MPVLMLVDFPNYTGPKFLDEPTVVPFSKFTFSADFDHNVTRTQFPFHLGYGITIHKSQGATLDKVKVNLGPREFSMGLTNVALTRTKSYRDLAIVPCSYDRFLQLKNSKTLLQRLQEDGTIAKSR